MTSRESDAPRSRESRAERVELRHLRHFVTVVDAGGFTAAAERLFVSQAAVSRNVRALEEAIGVRLLARTSRTVRPTAAGVRVLMRARTTLAAVDELVHEAAAGESTILLGHAWASFGARTPVFQRRWRAEHPDTALRFVHHHVPSGGLAEGLCDISIVRGDTDLRAWPHALVGHEQRAAVMSTDDPWARRRVIRWDELRTRRLLVDRVAGTTHAGLWEGEPKPEVAPSGGIDDWLALIAAGEGIGVSAEATAAQYRRDGIVYRTIRDAPPIPVHLVWRADDAHPLTPAVVALAIDLYYGADRSS
ncbi:LysR family transcriptional regulator [Gulosibacter faecalis]|uniref:LysR family transcriptional regulator n=1 Tax=Gulosibacter faecalis TaxID=272240 RepID=A0ABW5UZ57_9MICO|nr:LysR family transcriptional regulator [Gulosibacter faecalis]